MSNERKPLPVSDLALDTNGGFTCFCQRRVDTWRGLDAECPCGRRWRIVERKP